MLRIDEHGERIPITIADSNAERGDITIVVQGIGKTTRLLNSLGAGEAILDVVGPLGKPSEVELFGTACVIGGGVGAAIAYPTAVALKRAGNRVISILGGRTRALVVLEDEIRATSDALHVTTDDGSHGEKGLVTDRLKALPNVLLVVTSTGQNDIIILSMFADATGLTAFLTRELSGIPGITSNETMIVLDWWVRRSSLSDLQWKKMSFSPEVRLASPRPDEHGMPGDPVEDGPDLGADRVENDARVDRGGHGK